MSKPAQPKKQASIFAFFKKVESTTSGSETVVKPEPVAPIVNEQDRSPKRLREMDSNGPTKAPTPEVVKTEKPANNDDDDDFISRRRVRKTALFDSDSDEDMINPRKAVPKAAASPVKRVSIAAESGLDDFASAPAEAVSQRNSLPSVARTSLGPRASIAQPDVGAHEEVDNLEMEEAPPASLPATPAAGESTAAAAADAVVSTPAATAAPAAAPSEAERQAALRAITRAVRGETSDPTKRVRDTEAQAEGSDEEDEEEEATPKIAALQKSAAAEEEDLRQRLLATPAAMTSPMFREYVEALLGARGRFKWPLWMEPTRVKDARGKRPTDPDYDPSTCMVPSSVKECKAMKPDMSSHFTPAMAQYWQIKGAYFDKLVLFKVGKFYEIFYVDAVAAQRALDLKWMGSSEKAHVGFPEVSLHGYAERLVAAGYQVVVVEQTETPAELAERNKTTSGPKDSAVRREVCEVYTPGTVTHEKMLQPSAKILLALAFEECRPDLLPAAQTDAGAPPCSMGVAWADVSTGALFVGRLEDGRDRSALSTLLAQLAPAEIVFNSGLTPPDVLRFMRHLSCHPALSSVGAPQDLLKAEQAVRDCFPPAMECPALLVDGQHPSVTMAAALLADKLSNSLLAASFFPVATVRPLSDWTMQNFNNQEAAAAALPPKRMFMDAAALAQLEILEASEPGGALLDVLDNTSTPFGKRLLRSWVCAPLADKPALEERLDAVEFLMQQPQLVGVARKALGALPDLERSIARVVQLSQSGKRKAVYFGDITRQRLRLFLDMLDSFEAFHKAAQNIVETAASSIMQQKKLANVGEAAKHLPARLRLLLLTQEKGGCLPEVGKISASLKDWVETRVDPATGKSDFEPVRGHVVEYDEAEDRISAIVADLEKELKRLKKETGEDSLKFVSTKFRFEVVAPEGMKNSLLKNHGCEVTSIVKGFVRVHTDEIKELVEQLDAAEQQKQDAWFPFLKALFSEFHRVGTTAFHVAARCAAELDCLLSLAIASEPAGGQAVSTRPRFLDTPSASTPSTVRLVQGRHPVLARKLGDAFVPNSVVLGSHPDAKVATPADLEAEVQAKRGEKLGGVLLVTGPNMGGKSTLLRMTALCVVMAQIGCFVPADAFELTLVDRIFSRVGARDSLLEGKSTFYVELEETAAILKGATNRSLAVLDELGRGTSTFDGTALALATLEALDKTIGCLSLFSTHYHLLADEARWLPGVTNVHMAAHLDKEHQTLAFLYTLTGGAAPKSHGLHVARLAGVPSRVLVEAGVQSAVMEGRTRSFHTVATLAPLLRKMKEMAAAGDKEGLQEMYQVWREFALLQVKGAKKGAEVEDVEMTA